MSLAVLAVGLLVVAGFTVGPILADSSLPRLNLGGPGADRAADLDDKDRSRFDAASHAEPSAAWGELQMPDPDADWRPLTVRGDEALRSLAEVQGAPGVGTADDPLILHGESLLETGLDAMFVQNTSIHLEIHGLMLKGHREEVGLTIKQAGNVSLREVTMKNFGTGVRLEETGAVKIDNATFISNERAIQLIGAQDVEVDDSRFSNNKHAVEARQGERENQNLSLSGNRFEGARQHPEGSMEEPDTGDSVMLTGSGHRVQGNNFTGQAGTALRVHAQDVWIGGNQFSSGQHRGVVVKQSSGTTLVDNRFEAHEDAALFTIDTTGTLIKDNKFVDNPSGAVQGVNDTALHVEGNRFIGSGAAVALWATHQGVLDKNTVAGGTHGFRVTEGSDVRLEANKISKVSTGGVAFFGGRDLGLVANTFTDAREYGVYVSRAEDLRVEANVILGSGHGVVVTDDSADVRLVDNELIGRSNVGIRVAQSERVLLTGNEIRLHGFAVLVDNEASKMRIVGGILSENQVGILITQAESSVSVEGVAAKGNQVGVRVDGTGGHDLTGLELSDNKIGLQLAKTQANTITASIMKHNRVGLHMENSTMNHVYDNLFNNALQSDENVVLKDSPENEWSIRKTSGPNIVGGPWIAGNWWHDYGGADLDGDGIGETPHEPVPDHELLEEPGGLVGTPMGPFDLQPLVR